MPQSVISLSANDVVPHQVSRLRGEGSLSSNSSALSRSLHATGHELEISVTFSGYP
jgi:hypothetical protein